MPNYENGKVYKITSNQTNKIYIGSTSKMYLSQRLGDHKSAFKTRANGKINDSTAYEILQYDDAEITLIESYPCNTKDELLSRERYYIDVYKDICVNKCRPKVSDEEKKQYWKDRYIQKKEEIKAHRSQVVDCECGGHYTIHHKQRHLSSARHKRFLGQ